MINFLSALTEPTQICIVLVLVLMVALASGVVGYQMGIARTIEYLDRLNITEGGEHR